MTRIRRISARVCLFAIVATQAFTATYADIVLSQLIVDLQPGKHGRDDIEIWNSGTERAYVALDAREIVDAGLAGERRRDEPDPEKLGLLVSPARMILEPGQRRLARIANIGEQAARERVYRVTVKPVAGPLAANDSALKILIGYDVLVLVRPAEIRPNLIGRREGATLTFRNDGNASVELVEGRQCDAALANCTNLPGKRLYAGAQWSERLHSAGPVQYTVRSSTGTERLNF